MAFKYRRLPLRNRKEDRATPLSLVFAPTQAAAISLILKGCSAITGMKKKDIVTC